MPSHNDYAQLKSCSIGSTIWLRDIFKDEIYKVSLQLSSDSSTFDDRVTDFETQLSKILSQKNSIILISIPGL